MDIAFACCPGTQGSVQKTVASRRTGVVGVAGCWIGDGKVSLDAELFDIPGLVVEIPSAGIGLATLVSS